MSKYPQVKKWRNKSKKNKGYNNSWMKIRRKMYRTMFLAGKIAYKDVPRAYRYWKNPAQ